MCDLRFLVTRILPNHRSKIDVLPAPASLVFLSMGFDIQLGQVGEDKLLLIFKPLFPRIELDGDVMSNLKCFCPRFVQAQVWIPSNRDSSHLAAKPAIPDPCRAATGCDPKGEPDNVAVPNQYLTFGRNLWCIEKPLSKPTCHVCTMYATGLILADLDCGEANINAGQTERFGSQV